MMAVVRESSGDRRVASKARGMEGVMRATLWPTNATGRIEREHASVASKIFLFPKILVQLRRVTLSSSGGGGGCNTSIVSAGARLDSEALEGITASC